MTTDDTNKTPPPTASARPELVSTQRVVAMLIERVGQHPPRIQPLSPVGDDSLDRTNADFDEDLRVVLAERALDKLPDVSLLLR